MTAVAWYGLIISFVAVLAAYRIGFAAGFESGRDAGEQDGRRQGAREGSVRGYAVGFDRGRRRAESPADNAGGDKAGVAISRYAVGLVGLALAAVVLFSICKSAEPRAGAEIRIDRSLTPLPPPDAAPSVAPSVDR